jgi:hypothetical protein
LSYEAVRSSLVAFVTTAWAAGAFASTPIEFENIELIDHDAQALPFVTCDITWRPGVQASLGAQPLKRTQGELLFHIHLKEGAGSKPALQMADVLDAALTWQKVSGTQILATSLQKSVLYKGWRIWPLSVPFWFDQ